MDFPNDFAAPRVQTIHLTASALPVNFSGLDDQCRGRTAALLGVERKFRVNQFILTTPEQLAGRFLKAQGCVPKPWAYPTAYRSGKHGLGPRLGLSNPAPPVLASETSILCPEKFAECRFRSRRC